MPTEIRVKKVKAYPFPAQLTLAFGPSTGHVLKLTPFGLLAEVADPRVQTGDKLEISFELPVLHHKVHEKGVVVKLYNQFAGAISSLSDEDTGVAAAGVAARGEANPNQSEISEAESSVTKYGDVQRIAEIHFKPITLLGKKHISEFLQQLAKPQPRPKAK